MAGRRKAATTTPKLCEKVLDTFSSEDAEKIKALEKEERNVANPVSTCWLTVLKAANMVADNWTIIYFILLSVK